MKCQKMKKSFIFKCRSNMLKVKLNRKKLYQDLTCEAWKLQEQSQMHILQCYKLKGNDSKTSQEITYKNIFDDNILKMKKVSKERLKILKTYQKDKEKHKKVNIKPKKKKK